MMMKHFAERVISAAAIPLKGKRTHQHTRRQQSSFNKINGHRQQLGTRRMDDSINSRHLWTIAINYKLHSLAVCFSIRIEHLSLY